MPRVDNLQLERVEMKKGDINYIHNKSDMLAKMFPSQSLSITVLLKSHHVAGFSK